MPAGQIVWYTEHPSELANSFSCIQLLKLYMLHLLKKLKLYTKMGPETERKAPISIHIKIYLWSFVDYQHLQKYFYNWNIITLNHCLIYKINIRGNFTWKCLTASNTHIISTLFHPL